MAGPPRLVGVAVGVAAVVASTGRRMEAGRTEGRTPVGRRVGTLVGRIAVGRTRVGSPGGTLAGTTAGRSPVGTRRARSPRPGSLAVLGRPAVGQVVAGTASAGLRGVVGPSVVPEEVA